MMSLKGLRLALTIRPGGTLSGIVRAGDWGLKPHRLDDSSPGGRSPKDHRDDAAVSNTWQPQRLVSLRDASQSLGQAKAA